MEGFEGGSWERLDEEKGKSYKNLFQLKTFKMSKKRRNYNGTKHLGMICSDLQEINWRKLDNSYQKR